MTVADNEGTGLSELSHRRLQHVAAALLEAQGYVVHFANRPNYPHWDLIAYGSGEKVVGVYVESVEPAPRYDGRVSLEDTMEWLDGEFTDILLVVNQAADDDREPASANLMDRPDFELWDCEALRRLIRKYPEVAERFDIQGVVDVAPVGQRSKSSAQDSGETVDVAILVALLEEFEQLEAELGDIWEPRPNAIDGAYDYFWIDEHGGYRCVATFIDKMGPQEAVVGAKRLLRYSPATLVNIGIAAGLHEDICIGDVVVPDVIQAYDKTGKANEAASGWTWQARPDAFRTEHVLVEEAKHLRMARREAFFAWQAAGASEFAQIEASNPAVVGNLLSIGAIRQKPQIRVVPVASGCFVVASRTFAEWVRQQNAELKATEMEAAGMLLSATKQRAHVQTLVIRGVSDHVCVPKGETDAIKSGALRRLAMQNAWRLFQVYLVTQLLPRTVEIVAPASKSTGGNLSVRIAALEEERNRRLIAGESTALVDERILAERREERDRHPPKSREILSDRFVLLDRIGAGGFATVWRALDQSKGRLVAIKLLHSQWMYEQSRISRFKSAAKRLKDFRHQSIVGVLNDPVHDEHRCYYAMEWMPGGDLERALLEKRVDRRQALISIAQALEGLMYAHEQGVIHRDLKPSNILLDASGRGRLSDFDLALAFDSTQGTRMGGLGTFIYAAPEQLNDAGRVNTRADIYSAGMTVLFALLGKDPPPLVALANSKLLDELPCGSVLRSAVRTAVAYDAEDRNISCAELIAAIVDETNVIDGAMSLDSTMQQQSVSHALEVGTSAQASVPPLSVSGSGTGMNPVGVQQSLTGLEGESAERVLDTLIAQWKQGTIL